MDEKKGTAEFTELAQQLRTYIGKIKYGSVTLVIQDSKVIQIESHEKVRIDRRKNKELKQ